jgi:hypothetical protein
MPVPPPAPPFVVAEEEPPAADDVVCADVLRVPSPAGELATE